MIDFSVLPSQDKIYYQDSETVIYCGDAMEIAPLLPRGELLLTDPPYGIGEDSETQRSRAHLADPTDYGDYHWDKKISRELLYAAMNTAKNQAISAATITLTGYPHRPAGWYGTKITPVTLPIVNWYGLLFQRLSVNSNGDGMALSSRI